MLNLFGNVQRLCNGASRRDFLRIGTLGLVATSATIFAGVLACATWISTPSSAGDQPMRSIKGPPEPAAIPAEQFGKLQALIKPQPGELRFHEIPWLIDVWEARKKAAAEGKPILVWSGAGGSPLGAC